MLRICRFFAAAVRWRSLLIFPVVPIISISMAFSWSSLSASLHEEIARCSVGSPASAKIGAVTGEQRMRQEIPRCTATAAMGHSSLAPPGSVAQKRNLRSLFCMMHSCHELAEKIFRHGLMVCTLSAQCKIFHRYCSGKDIPDAAGQEIETPEICFDANVFVGIIFSESNDLRSDNMSPIDFFCHKMDGVADRIIVIERPFNAGASPVLREHSGMAVQHAHGRRSKHGGRKNPRRACIHQDIDRVLPYKFRAFIREV